MKSGGEAEIRTRDGLTPIAVFETAAFNHSATSPFYLSDLGYKTDVEFLRRKYRAFMREIFERVLKFDATPFEENFDVLSVQYDLPLT